jgi:hypothetical protein
VNTSASALAWYYQPCLAGVVESVGVGEANLNFASQPSVPDSSNRASQSPQQYDPHALSPPCFAIEIHVLTLSLADYFQSVHGFFYTSDENIPLVFPVVPDSGQLNVVFHTIVRLCQDGENVSAEADGVLRAGGVDNQAGGARVLDVITNCGTWLVFVIMIFGYVPQLSCWARVQEMAEAYPTATFLSIDVKPLVPFDPHARIDFEVYDLYAGIAEPDASFDVVHARQCVTTVRGPAGRQGLKLGASINS